MKILNIKVLFILLTALTINSYLIGQSVPQLNSDPLAATNQYVKRVNIDEGKVANKNLLNSFIELATKDNWYNEIKFWTSAQWGIKESDGNISKQYELNGKDLTTDGFDKRPKKITDGELLGVKYDGSNDYTGNSNVTIQNPLSLLIVFKANETVNENILIDSKGSKKHAVSIEKNKDGVNELVVRTAGEVYIKGIKSGINILYIEFNTKNSRVYVNGELVYSGIIGKSEIDGLLIGRGSIKNSTVYFNGLIYETGIINNVISDEARTNLLSMIKQVYKVQ
jgi:hypothetical protein